MLIKSLQGVTVITRNTGVRTGSINYLFILATCFVDTSVSQNLKTSRQKVNFPDSTRVIKPENMVVPEGYKIEAIHRGLSYPVDVTFDEA